MKLFIPGPVEMAPAVLDAMSVDMFPHRSARFREMFGSVQNQIQKLLNTKNSIVLLTASGTALMESAVKSVVGRKLFVYSIGAFGNRWKDLADRNGVHCDVFEAEWGSTVDPAFLRQRLASGQYDTFAFTHNETSTGVINDLTIVYDTLREFPDILSLADAVSSMGAVPIDLSRTPFDVFLASSQKGLGVPPGLAVAAVSDKCRERMKHVFNRGYYLDLLTLCEYADNRETHTTPSISHIHALDESLKIIFAGGLDSHYSAIREKALRVQKWAREHAGLLCKTDNALSPVVTAILNKKAFFVAALNAHLEKSGFLIANGYGKLKEKTFRIAHIGNISLEETNTLLSAIDVFIH